MNSIRIETRSRGLVTTKILAGVAVLVPLPRPWKRAMARWLVRFLRVEIRVEGGTWERVRIDPWRIFP